MPRTRHAALLASHSLCRLRRRPRSAQPSGFAGSASLRVSRFAPSLAIALLGIACDTSDTARDATASSLLQAEVRAEGKRAWGTSDAPSLLGDDLETKFAALPTSGEAASIPWAGSYWPTWKDSLNDRWAGEDSESVIEKYERAFGVPEGLDDRFSSEYGIDSINGESCSTDADCEGDKGAKCAIRTGETEGTCVETWFGLCHAWAPVAILEDEPVSPVTYNGVTFQVNDLKALATAQFDKALPVKFMSLRCNEKAGGEDWALDAYGNPTDQSCADTNAGSFHVVVANLLGVQRVSFVEDRTYDYEVWNQPVRSYEITTSREVDAAEANTLAGDTSGATDYAFNDDAVSFRYVELTLEYIGESDSTTDGNLAADIDRYTHSDDYTYVLELDADGAIIGGEWSGDSKTNHPDFLWLPTGKTESELAKKDGATGTGMKWSDVKALLIQSAAGAEGAIGGFDWGAGCEAGSGSFEKYIASGVTETIGDVPGDKADVRIDLKSDADVDVQLLDAATGTEIIAWPNGMLNGDGEGCTTYEGVEVCYSGYNGDGTNYGHEWIEIRGETGRTFTMKAYGYAAGEAEVEYSWQPAPGCVDSGSGSFAQEIVEKDVVAVGVLPAGKVDLEIALTSDADVDLQLFDGATALVQWPSGMLNGAGEASVEYEGATITWSGYNGTDGEPGHEKITISGELQSDLILKAYGYAEGEAQIEYAWGVGSL